MSKPCLLLIGVNKAERLLTDNHTTLMVSESIQNNRSMKKTQVWRIASCRKAKN